MVWHTTLYHATNWDSADDIDWHGFRAGWGGHQGAAIYMCDSPGEAGRRSRNGNDVWFEVQVRLYDEGYSYDGYSYAIYDNWQIKGWRRM